MNQVHVHTLRKWRLFTLSIEKWDLENSDPPVEMEVYRTLSGDYLGSRFNKRRPGLIKFIERNGIRAEKASPEHSVCSIGRCDDGSWYGWSHRAVCRFHVGDKLFDAEFSGATEDLPFVEWGDIEIKNEVDSRQAAVNFGAYVS